MTSPTLRLSKGSALTHSEMDSNFASLYADKLETSTLVSNNSVLIKNNSGAISSAAISTNSFIGRGASGEIGSFAATTTNIAEGSRLYYTDTRAVSAPLTGYISGSGVVTASDTVLSAIQKITGNITALNIFSNIAVSGQTTVVADSNSDTLTLVAGGNIVITTDAVADSLTIDTSPYVPNPGGYGTNGYFLQTDGAGGWTWASIGGGGDMLKTENLSGLSNYTTARSNLGLGSVENTALSTWAGTANITTLGTISTGVWSGTAIGVTKGGTGLTSIAAKSIWVANSANTVIALTPAAGQSVRINSGGTAWEAYTSGDMTGSNNLSELTNTAAARTNIGLGSVENTALSTWAGTSNITTLGTITTGVWSGTAILPTKGGTGLTSLGTGLQVLRTNAGATAMEWATVAVGSGDLLAANNLSDVLSASTARTNLGLAIGSDVQAYNSNLATISGLTATTDNFIVSVASAWASRTPSQAKVTLAIDNVENTALSTWSGTSNITTLGTVTTGTWSGTAVGVTKGGTGKTSITAKSIWIANSANTLTEITPAASQSVRINSGNTAWEAFTPGDMLGSNNLSEITSASTARTNIGLGSVENTALSTWTGAISITTLGTIGTGVWNGTTIAVTKGGTGMTAVATRSILVTQSANVFSYLSPSAGQSVRINAGNTAWEVFTPGDVVASNNLSDLSSASTARTNLGLGSVENTALSTWSGTSNITTLGTIATGTWNATAIGVTKGGTGLTGVAAKSILITNTAHTFTVLTPSAGQSIRINGGNTAWEVFTPGDVVASNNLSDLSSASTARTNLGLGSVENTALSTWGGSANITVLGTIATGTWNATTIGVTKGGTGKTSITAKSIWVANSANTLVEVTPAASQSIRINAGNTAWEAYTPGDLVAANNLSDLSNAATARTNIGLGNVQNTALSTWAGTTSITTLGTITTGTWSGTTIGVTKGGTGITSIATRSILVTQSANVFSYLSPAAGQSVRINAGGTAWEVFTPGTMIGSNNLSEISSASTARTNLGLGNVENTALSTWTGTTNIVTLGTITTGTWGGTAIGVTKGGTGLTSIAAKSVLVSNSTSVLTAVTPAAGQSIRINSGDTAWEVFTPGDLVAANNLSDLSNAATARTNLGLGNVQNTALSTWAGTSSITTLGTISTGTWDATAIGVTKGGTGLTALGTGLQVLRTNAGATAMEWATISAGGGDLLASNNLSDLVSVSTARTNLGLAIGADVQAYNSNLATISGLTATTDNFIVSVASAWASRTPAQVKTTLSLNNVENTALSTWAGTSNITTLGTIASGTWNATTIGVTKGGTGLTGIAAKSVLITNTAHTLTVLTPAASQSIRINASNTAWEAFTPGDVVAANNLSDLANAGTARTNLGLGSVENTALSTWTGTANITTLGTVSTGTWNATTIGITKGGTGKTSITAKSIWVANSANTLVEITPTALQSIRMNAGNTAWEAYTGGDLLASNNLSDLVSASTARTNLGLGSVENTALSTWAGTTNMTTLGSITTGTWNASTIAVTKGGTGLTTIATRSILVTNSANVLSAVTPAAGQSVRINAGNTAWEAYTPGNMLGSNNLSEITSASTARTNLGLGSVENVALSTWTGSTNIVTLGTITTGTWNGDVLGVAYGGTGNSTLAAGSILITNSANTLTNLTVAAGRGVRRNAGGTAWESFVPGDLLASNNLSDLGSVATAKVNLSLNNVENTALSTWAGTANITTLGTISTGTWNGTAIGISKGGTGLTALGTALQVLRTNAGATAMEWATISSGGGDLLAANNLNDLDDASLARFNLGLGSVEDTALSTWSGTSNIDTVGTISSGTWNGNVITASYGGTGLPTVPGKSIIITSTPNTFTSITPTAGQSVRINAGGTAWEAYTPGNMLGSNNLSELTNAATARTNLGLGNVQNTALSTWAGTTTIITVGTISTGIWSGTAIGVTKGGTGLTSIAAKSVLISNSSNVLAALTPAASQSIRINSGNTAWEAFTPLDASNNLSDVGSVLLARQNLEVDVTANDLSSSSTVNLGGISGDSVSITGTTGITGFTSGGAGMRKVVTFTNVLVLTHSNALQLPNDADITTAAGDTAMFLDSGSNNWKCLWYARKNGHSIKGQRTKKVSMINVYTAVDSSGHTTSELASVNQTNDKYVQNVFSMADSGTDTGIGIRFTIPDDYVSGGTIKVLYSSGITSGTFAFAFEYTLINPGESMDPNVNDESVDVLGSAPSTPFASMEADMSLGGDFNPSESQVIQGYLVREGSNVSDDVTGDLVIFDVLFEYKNY